MPKVPLHQSAPTSSNRKNTCLTTARISPCNVSIPDFLLLGSLLSCHPLIPAAKKLFKVVKICPENTLKTYRPKWGSTISYIEEEKKVLYWHSHQGHNLWVKNLRLPQLMNLIDKRYMMLVFKKEWWQVIVVKIKRTICWKKTKKWKE